MAIDIARRRFVTGLSSATLAWPLAARAQQPSPPSAGNLNVTPGNVPPRRGGLKGNSNYFLYSDCKPVMDLSVTIKVTQDIVADFGLSFQLNAHSPPGANCVWQQYCIGFGTNGGPPTLGGDIDNWPAKGFDELTGDIINHHVHLLTLPGSKPILPAGYRLTINLSNDANGTITGVTFVIVDHQGKITKSQPIALRSLFVNHHPPRHPPQPIGAAELAPIHAFQLNLVGRTNAEATYLATGAGTITYSAKSRLTVLSQQPACIAARNVFTMEQANSTYGELPASPSNQITQSFGAAAQPLYTPGGSLAVSRQFGTEQTSLFAVSRNGRLGVFYVQGKGRWKQAGELGPIGLARAGAAVAASQQFGAKNQTDVFVIGQNGQLNVFWVQGAGAWNGPLKIGPAKHTRSGANLAVSRQFGVDRTDVFLVDRNGQLNVFSVEGAGSWSDQPVLIGPKDFAPEGAPLASSRRFGVPNQTDVFVVGNDGQLSVFSVQGAGSWSEPEKIGAAGTFPKGAHVAASQQFGTDRTDVFVVDKKGQLSMLWVEGAGSWSQEPAPMSPKDFAVPGAPVAVSRRFGAKNQTDVFLVDKDGTLSLFWAEGAGAWNGPESIGPAGIAPSASSSSRGAFVAASPQSGATDQTNVFILNETGTNGPGWPTRFWVEGAGSWSGPAALVNET